MPKPLTKGDQERQLSFKPQILDPTSSYPKPFNGQRLPSQKIGLQRMRTILSKSKIHPKIQTQILSSSYSMVWLDSALTSLGFDFPHPLMIPGLDLQQIYPNPVILGLDPQQIYPNPISSHLSFLEIDLHPSVALPDLVYLSPDQREIQVQNSKVSKPNLRLVPLATQPDKSQLLIKMTTTVEKPLLHPIRVQKLMKNLKVCHQLILTKDS